MTDKYKFLSNAILAAFVFISSVYIVPSFSFYTDNSAKASDLTSLMVKTPAGEIYRMDASTSELPRAIIKTHTPWTTGLQEFSGVSLKKLLEAAGFDEETARKSIIRARALNDYEVEIPGRDAYDYEILVADQMNGATMPVTKFGPFWIVYPRDDKPELQDSRFDHRWAWQLSELLVE